MSLACNCPPILWEWREFQGSHLFHCLKRKTEGWASDRNICLFPPKLLISTLWQSPNPTCLIPFENQRVERGICFGFPALIPSHYRNQLRVLQDNRLKLALNRQGLLGSIFPLGLGESTALVREGEPQVQGARKARLSRTCKARAKDKTSTGAGFPRAQIISVSHSHQDQFECSLHSSKALQDSLPCPRLTSSLAWPRF